MLIDWFTVVAQAVNFLILVWLMKRFLYQPILKALDAREKRIAAELADADAKRAAAEAAGAEFKRKNDEFDRQRTGLMDKATDDAANERNRLFESARTDAEGFSSKLQDKLNGEFRNLRDTIRHKTRDEVFAIARKTLTDLAGVSLEDRIADVFIVRLQGLNNEEKARLAAMLKTPDMPVLVRSAFELKPAQRAAIEGAVQATLSTKVPVSFEIVPDLISGIELIMQGQKVAWSIADYLASLEKDANELLRAHD